MLRVIVESASGIPQKRLGNPDPIAAVIFRGEKKKTKAIDSDLNPVWNEVLEFDLKGSSLDASSFINLVVKDYETIGKDKFFSAMSTCSPQNCLTRASIFRFMTPSPSEPIASWESSSWMLATFMMSQVML